MKQNKKDLLLKDLCARLPYGVFCEGIVADIDIDTDKYYDHKVKGVLSNIYNYKSICYATIGLVSECGLETIKPYLFPLESMTEEQYEEFIIISGWDIDIDDIRRGKFSCIGYVALDYMYDAIDWFNKNHFDYRGLIPMGSAIDATDLNVY